MGSCLGDRPPRAEEAERQRAVAKVRTILHTIVVSRAVNSSQSIPSGTRALCSSMAIWSAVRAPAGTASPTEIDEHRLRKDLNSADHEFYLQRL